MEGNLAQFVSISASLAPTEEEPEKPDESKNKKPKKRGSVGNSAAAAPRPPGDPDIEAKTRPLDEFYVKHPAPPPGTAPPHASIKAAVHSLERTILDHSHLMKRKYMPANKPQPNQPIGEQQVPKTAVRPDKVTVSIRVVFLKIGEIDTLKEQYSADAFVQARWREPALDHTRDADIDDVDWDKFWNPKVYIENSLGEPKETVWSTLAVNKKGEATVCEMRRIRGCFLENLELEAFPFDTQDLSLTVTSERSEAELQLEEDLQQLSSMNVQSFVDEQEWRLHSHVEIWKRQSERIHQNNKYKHPAISASCRATRRPGFFIWNIFLVMLAICSLAFSTFTVNLERPENRLQLSFILLLTTITFKFVVGQTLPRIPYLTYLDKYILTSMGIHCSICMWHSIVPLLKYNRVLSSTADRIALVILWTTYLLFHITFSVYVYYVSLQKRWTYAEKDRMHRERIRRIQAGEDDEAAEAAEKAVTAYSGAASE